MLQNRAIKHLVAKVTTIGSNIPSVPTNIGFLRPSIHLFLSRWQFRRHSDPPFYKPIQDLLRLHEKIMVSVTDTKDNAFSTVPQGVYHSLPQYLAGLEDRTMVRIAITANFEQWRIGKDLYRQTSPEEQKDGMRQWMIFIGKELMELAAGGNIWLLFRVVLGDQYHPNTYVTAIKYINDIRKAIKAGTLCRGRRPPPATPFRHDVSPPEAQTWMQEHVTVLVPPESMSVEPEYKFLYGNTQMDLARILLE